MATHHAKHNQPLCAQHGYTAVLGFLDVKAAVYSAVRELIVRLEDYTESWKDILQRMNLTDHEIRALTQHCERPTCLEHAGFSEHAHHLLRSQYTSTWLQLDGDDRCYRTQRGTIPGLPCSDMLYNLLGSRILKDLHERRRGRGCATELPPHQADPQQGVKVDQHADTAPDITFADDTVHLTYATNPLDALQAAQAIASTAVSKFAEYGLVLNLKR